MLFELAVEDSGFTSDMTNVRIKDEVKNSLPYNKL